MVDKPGANGYIFGTMTTEKTVNLNLRLPPTLHAELVAQAKTRRRSLNSEIVERLAGRPMDVGPLDVSPDLRGLLEVLGVIMDTAAKVRFGADAIYAPETLPNWLDDSNGYAAGAYAALRVLEEFQPPGVEFDPEHAAADDDNKTTGEGVAKSILRRIASDEPLPLRTAALRAALGPRVERIRIAETEAAAREIEARIDPREDSRT
jgi:hypothetical protein